MFTAKNYYSGGFQRWSSGQMVGQSAETGCRQDRICPSPVVVLASASRRCYLPRQGAETTSSTDVTVRQYTNDVLSLENRGGVGSRSPDDGLQLYL